MDPITPKTLTDARIDLTGKDVDSLIEHLNETLEERVGTEVTESLDDDQLQAMLELQEKGTDEELAQWLTTNVPEIDEIVQDEMDILLGELAENSDTLNG